MKNKFFNIIKFFFAFAIIFFLLKYIISNIEEIEKYEFKFNYLYLILSILGGGGYFFYQSLIWYYITKKNSVNISFLKTITTRVYSEFGKYIPGKIFGYTALVYVYNEENKSKKVVAFCIFFELITSIISSIFMFFISVFSIDIPIFNDYKILFYIAFIVFFILINPKILEHLSNTALKLFKKEQIKLDIIYVDLLKIISLYIVKWFLFGVSFMFFINSISDLSYEYFFYVTGTTALAGLIGLFAIFVPAGLGVREGVMTIALSEIMLNAFAGIIAILSRLWLTASEIFVFIIIFSINLILKQRKKYKTVC